MDTCKSTFRVPDMSCEHCVKAIKSALGQLNGIAGVEVDLPSKHVTVRYDDRQMAPDVIARALEAAGYPATVKDPAGC